MVRAVLTFTLVAALHGGANPPRPVPQLVVVITVDQFRGDYLDRWRSQLVGGLAQLLRRGAVFTDAYQDHAMAETAPGHATVLSGRNPHATGIVRNEAGVEDPTEALIGVDGPGASPVRFRGTELYDWMAARYPDARALSVSRKDRAAILPIGHARAQVYWYQGGRFTTSRYYADSLPGWLTAFNAGVARAYAPGKAWTLLLPAQDYAEPDSEPYEHGGRDVAFPHVLPADPEAAARAVMTTPFIDSLTLALALDGLQQLGLGTGPHPDLLAVSLSATDYIGHAYGPDSREMHDQVLHLDRYLGAFLDSLGRLRDPARIVIALTADHGVTPYPQWSRAHGDTAARVVAFDSLIAATEKALTAQAGPCRWNRFFDQGMLMLAMGYGGLEAPGIAALMRATGEASIARACPERWIRFFDLGMLVMDRPRLAARGVDVDSVVRALAAEMRRSPGVLRVDTPRDLAAADTATDAVARRWLNAIPPDLGVVLVVTLRPHDVWGPASSAEHGQPSYDDTHVPLIIAGPGVAPGRYTGRVEVADLAPTLARLIGRDAAREAGWNGC